VPRLTPTHKGAIAETAVAAEAIRLGIEVYRPIVEGGRADYVFGFPDRTLARVQCKWACVQAGALVIRAYSSRRVKDGLLMRTYSADEVDAVVAYCAPLDRCFYVPIELIADVRQLHLRLQPARNNQRASIHWAANYELGAIAQLGERRAGSAKVAGSNPASST
jgi:hypothetical protein